MWKPKNPKSRTLIKLVLWSGIIVWSVFFVTYGIIGARRLADAGSGLFGLSAKGQILTWVVPIWVVFTIVMLVWAVFRFVNKRFK